MDMPKGGGNIPAMPGGGIDGGIMGGGTPAPNGGAGALDMATPVC